MVVILDTNHISELDRGSEFAANFERRQRATKAEVFTTIVTVEEVLHGWINLIRQCRKAELLVSCYARLQRSVRVLSDWDVLPFDEEAISVSDKLRAQRVRIGTMDLRIASIALAHDATLLTRNTTEFRRVPGLKIENWLD
jgi:tRNA(fMet)-specific endonuclease VapC